jgi:ribosomal protein S16
MISISAGAKRKAIIDKVASNVIEKIGQYGPHEDIEKEVFQKLEDEYGAQLTISTESPTDLIFKVIDENGETTNSLSIEDSKFLRHKLEEITKDTVNKNMM